MTQLLDRVASAQSEAEVIQTAAEYVDTWSPPDLAKLPAPCRPGRRLDAGDIIFLDHIGTMGATQYAEAHL